MKIGRIKRVKKRNNSFEDYSADKFHEKVFMAAEGLPDVSVSEIEMNAEVLLVDKIETRDIHKALIKSAADKITPENPGYQKAAARLLNQDLRKVVYGQYNPLPFLEMVQRNADAGFYDKEYLFEHYSQKEIEFFGSKLNYNLDDNFVYSGLKKTIDSYLVRRYNEPRETPQEMFMLINMFAFAKYPKKLRKKWVLEGYKILSSFEASLPTPIMISLRTSFRKIISCNLLATGDSKETIANTSKAIHHLVASGAGIGLGMQIRGEGSDVDNGRMEHTGVLPVLKGLEKNTKAFVQPSRDGSTTVYYPFFHSEITSMMVWGNNKGTEETRIRDMDHAILFNKLFFDRYKNDEDITLFYMNDVPDLLSYMGDDELFKELYEKYERNIPKKNQIKIKASKILEQFVDERFLQSREYTEFLNNVQQQGLYKTPIIMSNLCTEITQPVFPIRDISIKRNIIFNSPEDKEEFYQLRLAAYFHMTNENKMLNYQMKMRKLYTFSNNDITAPVNENLDYDYFTLDGLVNLSEIGVCILAGINMGYCTDDRLPIVSEYLVRFLEELVDYMEYELPEVEKAAKMRRPFGIGFSDVFHLLAKNKVFYNTKEGRQFVHDRVELCAYHMIRTSIDLAKERGPCKLITDTKWADGILPIDTYNRKVDELVDENKTFDLDWEELRKDLLKYGIRNSSLMANAPFGSSSMVSNSTPGVEPPRDIANTKKGVTKLVPDIRYKNYYTTAWSDDFNNIDYFKFLAVFQKWIDQTISVNQYHNLLNTNGKKKKSELIHEVLTAYAYGLKTLYYSNIRSTDQKDGLEEEEQTSCGSGGCEV